MKYLRIFLITGLFFGVWMGIIYPFAYSIVYPDLTDFTDLIAGLDTVPRPNVYTSLIAGSAAGITFGFYLAAFAYFSDQRLKKKGIDISNTNPRQSRKISVDKTVSEIIPVCERAILSLNKASITKTKKDLTAGTIKAKTKMSWTCFGEVIKISTQSLGDNETLIEIKSSPFIPTTVIDYSRGLENVETIVSYIKSELNGEVIVGR